MNELLTPGAVAVAAIAFCVLMLALAVFQSALIAGAPIGQYAWGGRDRVLPRTKRIGSVTSSRVRSRNDGRWHRSAWCSRLSPRSSPSADAGRP